MTDEDKKFVEMVSQTMQKCHYRDEVCGIGVCSLNVLPCERVLDRGQCEAVAKLFQSKGEEE